jgi:excisionase family DNA binding protein
MSVQPSMTIKRCPACGKRHRLKHSLDPRMCQLCDRRDIAVLHGGRCCRSQHACITPNELIQSPALAAALCPSARSRALLAATTITGALAAHEPGEAPSSTESKSQNGAGGQEPRRLLTAPEMAARLCIPETWIREQERRRRIPSVRIGRYVRFRPDEVEKALGGR